MSVELRISNLSKTYPNGVQALKDVTLTIPTGMFGLLGPNGAGKSTLMRTVATLQEPDTGSITQGDAGSGQVGLATHRKRRPLRIGDRPARGQREVAGAYPGQLQGV